MATTSPSLTSTSPAGRPRGAAVRWLVRGLVGMGIAGAVVVAWSGAASASPSGGAPAQPPGARTGLRGSNGPLAPVVAPVAPVTEAIRPVLDPVVQTQPVVATGAPITHIVTTSVAETVAPLATPITNQVTAVATPVVAVVQPVVAPIQPVTEALAETVVTPVLDSVQPIVDEVGHGVHALEPVFDSVGPIANDLVPVLDHAAPGPGDIGAATTGLDGDQTGPDRELEDTVGTTSIASPSGSRANGLEIGTITGSIGVHRRTGSTAAGLTQARLPVPAMSATESDTKNGRWPTPTDTPLPWAPSTCNAQNSPTSGSGPLVILDDGLSRLFDTTSQLAEPVSVRHPAYLPRPVPDATPD